MNTEQIETCEAVAKILDRAEFKSKAGEMILWGATLNKFINMIKKAKEPQVKEQKTKIEKAK